MFVWSGTLGKETTERRRHVLPCIKRFTRPLIIHDLPTRGVVVPCASDRSSSTIMRVFHADRRGKVQLRTVLTETDPSKASRCALTRRAPDQAPPRTLIVHGFARQTGSKVDWFQVLVVYLCSMDGHLLSPRLFLYTFCCHSDDSSQENNYEIRLSSFFKRE